MKKAYSRTHANRGVKLEMLVDMTNNQYRNRFAADIRKVPTPVKITNVSGAHVTGRLDTAEWVDYSGVYKGKSIIFDAKETKQKSFPLSNIRVSQYELLKSWNYHGALSFLLVAFWIVGKNEPEIYVLEFEKLESFWIAMEMGGRKSIPIAFFQEDCAPVKMGNGFIVDYLSALDL